MGESFLCPKCAAGTAVVDSRPSNAMVRRRRQCFKCRYRFTTYEDMDQSKQRRQVVRKIEAAVTRIVRLARGLK